MHYETRSTRGVAQETGQAGANRRKSPGTSIPLKLGDPGHETDAQRITTDHVEITTYVSDQVGHHVDAVDMPVNSFRPETPFNDLSELPPETQLETRAVLKACISARAALAQLSAVADSIPDPAILIHTIPMLEARASSEIENIVTTTDQLFRSAVDEVRADPATREALRYPAASIRRFAAFRAPP